MHWLSLVLACHGSATLVFCFDIRGILKHLWLLHSLQFLHLLCCTVCPIKGQRWQKCKGCDGTCRNPNPACKLSCEPGCSCPQYASVVYKGRCIPPWLCPLSCSECTLNHTLVKGCMQFNMACCAYGSLGAVCSLWENCITACFLQFLWHIFKPHRMSNWRPEVLHVQRMWWNVWGTSCSLPCYL